MVMLSPRVLKRLVMSFLIRSACGPDMCLKMESPSSLYRPMLSLPYSLQRSLRMKRPTNSKTVVFLNPGSVFVEEEGFP